MAPVGVTAQSAGSHPAGFVHPRALAVLKKAGLSAEGLSSKSWDKLPEKPDVVITLCADTEDIACPIYFGNVVRSHWGMFDPAKAQGDETAMNAVFTETLDVLRRRISALVDQLEAEPNINAARLQSILNNIAASGHITV